MEMHYKCMIHARGYQTNFRQSYDMLNNDQKPAEMEPIHARKTCYFVRLTRLAKRIYTTSAISMQEVTKTAKNRVMAGLKSHKNEPKQTHKEVETHALLMGHQHMQTREEEEGQPPPIWDLKTTFLPLKFL